MEENNRKEELNNTISIVYNVLKQYRDKEDIEPLFKRTEKLLKNRNITYNE